MSSLGTYNNYMKMEFLIRRNLYNKKRIFLLFSENVHAYHVMITLIVTIQK